MTEAVQEHADEAVALVLDHPVMLDDVELGKVVRAKSVGGGVLHVTVEWGESANYTTLAIDLNTDVPGVEVVE